MVSSLQELEALTLGSVIELENIVGRVVVALPGSDVSIDGGASGRLLKTSRGDGGATVSVRVSLDSEGIRVCGTRVDSAKILEGIDTTRGNVLW